MRKLHKVLLGGGIVSIAAGIGGIFLADNAKKNKKLLTVLSSILAIVGLGMTACVLDAELYPEEYEEGEEETTEEESEEEVPVEA